MRSFAVVLALVGCKSGKDGSPGGSGSGPATGSATVPTAMAFGSGSGSGSGKTQVSKIVFVKDDDANGLAVPFSGSVPQLPAANADASQIADFDSNATGPMRVWPVTLAIYAMSGGTPEQLVVVDDTQAEALSSSEDVTKETKILEVIHKAAGAAIDRLKQGGFSTLTELTAVDATSEHVYKVNDVTLAYTPLGDDGDALGLAVTNKQNEIVRSEAFAAYNQGEWNTGMGMAPCRYRPDGRASHVDPSKRYLIATGNYRWKEDCGPGPRTKIFARFDLTALATAHGDLEAIRALVTSKPSYTADAQVVTGGPSGGITAVDTSDKTAPAPVAKDLAITFSRDGSSAWITSALSDDRITDVAIKTADGWKLALAARSRGVADTTVNAEAKVGKRPVPASTPATGDPALRAVFDSLLENGLDDVAAIQPRLVAIGSAPKEHTIGGAILATGWNAAWKGKAKLTSVWARTTPSGTTGWVVAKVALQKPGYVVPFALVCIFDKQADGTWSLAHIHFSV